MTVVRSHSNSQSLRTLALTALLGLSVTGCDEPQPGPERGATLYVYCAQCHGEDGSGNETFKAPAIAGMPQWYVESQLIKFRDGARGDHPGDAEGLRMRPMARTLASPEELTDVAGHVASMPVVNPAPTVEGGDAAKGKELYATCVQCHGDRGQGVEQQKGPPLTMTSDWYLVAQLGKFKNGVRGADPEDATGLQMRPLAISIANEQAMKDLVAHIMSLR